MTRWVTSAFRPLLLAAGLLLAAATAHAQVGLGTATPDASAALDISSTTKGLLLPRLTEAQRTAIASPAPGLVVYQTNGTAGIYYYSGTQWLPLGGAGGAGDNLGNHTATQDLALGTYRLTGTNTGIPSTGLSLAPTGRPASAPPISASGPPAGLPATWALVPATAW